MFFLFFNYGRKTAVPSFFEIQPVFHLFFSPSSLKIDLPSSSRAVEAHPCLKMIDLINNFYPVAKDLESFLAVDAAALLYSKAVVWSGRQSRYVTLYVSHHNNPFEQLPSCNSLLLMPSSPSRTLYCRLPQMTIFPPTSPTLFLELTRTASSTYAGDFGSSWPSGTNWLKDSSASTSLLCPLKGPPYLPLHLGKHIGVLC